MGGGARDGGLRAAGLLIVLVTMEARYMYILMGQDQGSVHHRRGNTAASLNTGLAVAMWEAVGDRQELPLSEWGSLPP